MRKIALLSIVIAALAGCGGGGGNPGTCSGSVQYCSANSGGSSSGSNSGTGTVTGSSSSLAGQCAAPRAASVIDPLTSKPYGDVQGSLTTEKAWIKAFVNETYLWYNEVVDADPTLYVIGATVPYVEPSTNVKYSVRLDNNLDVVNAYFNSQRTTALSETGKPKDKFHFTVPTSEWLAESGSGQSVGFGFQVTLIASSPPRKALIAYSEPGSPAAISGLNRGTEFVSVNGVAVVDGDADVLNEGMFSPVAGKNYTFVVKDQGSSISRSVTLTPATITSVPVQNVRTLASPHTSVGYIQFNDHIATAESQLIAAINQLKAANGGTGVSDLVLDIRYNGGGYLDLASELAYMIAGPTNTNGKFFEKLSFNSKNPFNFSDADLITPFHKVSQGFSVTQGQALPTLNLSRVFVITGAGTCSASEAIMNGLRGAGVEVIQVGGTTCGKPYGFYPQDNCSVTYFTIQFKGVNQQGFGDYSDGFIPGGSGTSASNLPGCVVADDFSKPLGDITEGRIAAALRYRTSGSCGTSSTGVSASAAAALSSAEPVLGGRSELRENRFYRPKTQF